MTFFIFCWLGVGILGSTMQTGGGVVATRLNGNLVAGDATVIVDSVTGFAPSTAPAVQRVIFIDDERIAYTATATAPSPRFTGCTRGFGDTDDVAHLDDAGVRTASAGYVNQVMDYSVATIADASGLWAALAIGIALFRLIGVFFQINLGFLGTDMAFLTYIWAALGIGALVSFGLALAGGRRV